jgi:hypothetical protein
MARAWRRLNATAIASVPVNTGVYALRECDTDNARVYVAGARSRLGLRGELDDALRGAHGAALEFTYVSTNNYFTLYREWRDFPQRFDASDPFVRADGVTVAQRGPR